jgi:hypothetical protein
MLRITAAPLLAAIALTAHSQELFLPFDGRWFVAQAGDTLNVNHHMATPPQWFGVDFVKVGGPSGRELASVVKPSTLEHFYSWNQPVLAPVEGVVTSIVSDFPDNPLGKKDTSHPAGNHIVIRTEAETYVFLAHLMKGSTVVAVGDRLVRGQMVGRVGNSGNSDFPHLHMHMQNEPTINQGKGLNLLIGDMDVELTGKVFKDVRWPLIRGLFVEARQE